MKGLLSFFLIGFLLLPMLGFSQQFKLRKDSQYIKNYQIEFIASKNYLFVSSDGVVDVPIDSIKNISKIKVVDLDMNTAYDLYGDELKVKNDELHFSSGKLIKPVIVGNKKEAVIGINGKGGTSKLYIQANSSKIVEIPNVNDQYENRKIKKIRYFFTGGNNTLYNVKTNKKDIQIIPILYTCGSVDCLDKKMLIPEMEVKFTENSKYLEVDVNHQDIFINKDFGNLYVGYIALNYFVVKQKKIEKIGDNKCYNNFPEHMKTRLSSYKCPVISVVLE